jgi:hypothetical protein
VNRTTLPSALSTDPYLASTMRTTNPPTLAKSSSTERAPMS